MQVQKEQQHNCITTRRHETHVSLWLGWGDREVYPQFPARTFTHSMLLDIGPVKVQGCIGSGFILSELTEWHILIML